MIDKHENAAPGDPLIDEVRAIRMAIGEEYGNDVHRLCEHLREIEKRFAGRVVSLPGTTESVDA
ncbi:MAG: hypothetical protein IT449_18165 [Phycisphaerales bacterium]|nr:hypothetical protein [Phycisphaerales bacterium]